MKHTTDMIQKAYIYRNLQKSQEEIMNHLYESFHDENLEEDSLNAIKELLEMNNPGSQNFTDEQREERQKITADMRKTCVSFFAKHAGNVHYMKSFDEVRCREVSTLLEMGPDTFENKSRIGQIITEQDPKEVHSLFEDMMVHLASLDINKVNNYSDEEFVQHFNEFFPAALMGFESENILDAFKLYECIITPDEEKYFKQLRIRANDFCMQVANRADIIMSPYYQYLDHNVLKKVDFDLKEKITKVSYQNDGELSGYLNALESIMTDQFGQASKDIAELLIQAGHFTAQEGLVITPNEDGKQVFTDKEDEFGQQLTYMDTFQYVQDLKDGKKVYAARSTDRPDAPKVVHAFKMNKNGVIYEVPMVVKPGIIDYITDFFSRLFGGEGNKKVTDYKNRNLTEAAIDDQNKDKRPADEYKEAINFVKFTYPQKMAQKSMTQMDPQKIKEKLDLLDELKKRDDTLKEMNKGDESFNKDEMDSNENSKEIDNIEEEEPYYDPLMHI